MQLSAATARTPHPLWMRLGVFACLLAWLAATPSLLPGVVAGLGSFDGQHRVLYAARDGKVVVVFHHERGERAASHLHSPLAQVLTTLAQSGGATQDHVFTFAKTSPSRLTTPAAPPLATSAALSLASAHFAVLPLPGQTDAPGVAPRPPPGGTFALVCLRSTSLRI